MESIQSIISAESIARLSDRLYGKLTPERRRIFQELLLEEEKRYGQYSEKLDMVAHYIAKSLRGSTHSIIDLRKRRAKVGMWA